MEFTNFDDGFNGGIVRPNATIAINVMVDALGAKIGWAGCGGSTYFPNVVIVWELDIVFVSRVI